MKLVKRANEIHKLKEQTQQEATEQKRRNEFAKRKANMKAMIEAEEEEIRLLEKRAKEKLELKARLQKDEEDEEEAFRRKQEDKAKDETTAVAALAMGAVVATADNDKTKT